MFQSNVSILGKFLETQFHDSVIKYIGFGWSSIVFFVDNMVVRFPRQNTEDYVFEEYICRKLQTKTPFEIPQVKVFLDALYPYAMHVRIEGYEWDMVMNNTRIHFAKDCALFLSQIHNISYDSTIRERPQDSRLEIKDLEKQFSHRIDDHLLQTLCGKFERINPNSTSGKLAFIHADIRKNNMIFKKSGQLNGVFDWCNSGMGEIEQEFVKIYQDFGGVFLGDIIKEYELLTNNTVDINRVYDLSFIDRVRSLYWANNTMGLIKLCQELETP